MELVREFKNLGRNDAAIAGGKGASLGEMTQAGIPVPPGFVILAGAFEQFIEEADLKADIDSVLHNVNHEEMHTVEKASEKIQALILEAPMPKDIEKEIVSRFKKLDSEFVAVRSSATAEDSLEAAWAGQLESYLNTTKKTLLENVKRCWASLFTPRAIFYRFEKGLHDKHISVAVVVQKMVASEVSGIGFSVHPVTQDYNQLIIEAGFGLGEAIVSGSVTPDNYIVEKKQWRILDTHVSVQTRQLIRKKNGGNEWIDMIEEKGGQQVLNEKQIIELAKLIVHIEEHYGFPVDTEWAFEKGKFYIVQSRPITTLAKKPAEKKNDDPTVIDGQKWEMIVTRNFPLWLVKPHNEAHVSDLKYFGIQRSTPLLVLTTNGTHSNIFAQEEHLKEFGNQVLAAVNSEKGITKLSENFLKYGKKLLSSSKTCAKKPTKKNWDLFIADLRRFFATVNITVQLGRRGSALLAQKLKNAGFGENETDKLIATITYPKDHTPLFDSQLSLLKIAADLQKKHRNKDDARLQKWVNEYGNIPANYCEDPWTLKDARAQLANFLNKNCQEELAKLEKQHAFKVAEATKTLLQINNKEITILAHALQIGTILNEYRKNVLSKFVLLVQPVLKQAAKLAGIKDWQNIHYLLPEEIAEILEGKKIPVAKIVRNRDVVLQTVSQDGTFSILPKETTTQLQEYALFIQGKTKNQEMGSNEIKGFCANSGIAKGIVKIVLSRKDFDKFNSGDILVAPMTSVDYVPIMEKAAAFVTNEGGITSHAAIVSRELNKPCIIGTKNATQILKDGDYVEVDADKGTVQKIDAPSAAVKAKDNPKDEWEELIRSDFALYNVSVPFLSIPFSNAYLGGPRYEKLLLRTLINPLAHYFFGDFFEG